MQNDMTDEQTAALRDAMTRVMAHTLALESIVRMLMVEAAARANTPRDEILDVGDKLVSAVRAAAAGGTTNLGDMTVAALRQFFAACAADLDAQRQRRH
ncbi:MAG: hypothetical protein MUC68_02995 [Burkholderiaceae bacterium]|jgi:hypothetical protein|nr:hypothetical protein [Burkholderiaceae bacterium]